jgi:hypothetical protein
MKDLSDEKSSKHHFILTALRGCSMRIQICSIRIQNTLGASSA